MQYSSLHIGHTYDLVFVASLLHRILWKQSSFKTIRDMTNPLHTNFILTRIFTMLVFSILAIPMMMAQASTESDQILFNELKARDSLIFNLGYNQCDTVQLRNLLSDDMEFYHDVDGFLKSKEILIQNIPNLCRMPYKATRELIDNSLQVFPLYANGELYGAIQTGMHEFYGQDENSPRYLTSTAKFTHLWIKEDNDWKLKNDSQL